jgi:replicative DNA helicase
MTLNTLHSYGPGFQIKVLASLLNHKEFLINIHDILSEEYFDNQAHKWVVKEILKYYDKYHTTPTMEVLKVELKKVQNEVLQISIKEQLKEEYKNTPSVMLFRMKMKTVLGFTIRENNYWDDDVERRHIIYLDFFDDQKETIFRLKYL